MNVITFRTILKRITAIKCMMKDKSVPLRKKLLVVFGIAYLVFPLDLLPFAIFPFAVVDDIVLWAFILIHLKDTLDKYWIGEETVDLKSGYSSDKIIENVNFEVEKENHHE